jgi:hypothetical protein
MHLELSIFEMIMLVCFGISWPFAIFKTLRTKSVKGVSSAFYFLVLIGYLSGIIHKILFNFNYVLIFYVINALMVLIQIILFYYYKKAENRNTPPDWV